MSVPVEPKVKAATAGSIVAGLADWALARYLFPHLGDPTAQALILAAVPGMLAFAGGWLARHQIRPPVIPPVAPAVVPPKVMP
jgi:hypothetical protein